MQMCLHSLRLLIICTPPVPAAAPQNLTATALDSRTVLLYWLPPPLDAQNGIIQEYTISVTVSETREELVIVSNQTELMFSAHPYYTYTFTVAAVTIGPGPFGTEYTITTPEDGKQ